MQPPETVGLVRCTPRLPVPPQPRSESAAGVEEPALESLGESSPRGFEQQEGAEGARALQGQAVVVWGRRRRGCFRGVEEEEEMLLLFSPSPGSCTSSSSPRPKPLGGEEVVALGARGGCRRPAPTPRPRSPRPAPQW